MKAAIFDIDGTIIDSMGVWDKATGVFLANHGHQTAPEQRAVYRDMTIDQSMLDIQRRYVPGMAFDEIIGEFMRMVAFEYENSIPAKDGVGDYIKRLHSDGTVMMLATTGVPSLFIPCLKRLGLWDYFSGYVLSSDVGVDKSNPDVYLKALNDAGFQNPAEAYVFEDILKGIRSANSAGFKTVAVYDSTNAGDTEALKREACQYITGWRDLL